jgi:hypothetical protein
MYIWGGPRLQRSVCILPICLINSYKNLKLLIYGKKIMHIRQRKLSRDRNDMSEYLKKKVSVKS